ncbi:MAG TPA: hypothetical protein PKZ84_12100 [Anaerolineae bacterium]|nr:hypothetical protein [Anaerolineae bacterium]HQI85465.1 hypothetical protein [Anaerolineae bacterium]
MDTLKTGEEVTLDAPHIQERIRTAAERIVGDPSLTEDLLDAEAQILLRWAQAEVERLVLETADLDDDMAWQTLDPALRALRRYIRRVAKSSADADDPAAALHALLASPPVYTAAV